MGPDREIIYVYSSIYACMYVCMYVYLFHLFIYFSAGMVMLSLLAPPTGISRSRRINMILAGDIPHPQPRLSRQIKTLGQFGRASPTHTRAYTRRFLADTHPLFLSDCCAHTYATPFTYRRQSLR